MTSFGLLLPTREAALAGDWSVGPLVALAQRAEALGFSSVWAGDSLTARPRLEPLTLLSAVAASTSSVTVGTAALTAALRHPLLGASAIATLDRVAEGRLVLALGAGFPYADSEAEFDAVGVPFAGRVGLLGRVIDQWRAAWRGEVADGFPMPVRPAGPPLWFAGGGPSAPRVVGSGRFDGWLPYLPTPEAYGSALAAVRAAAPSAAAGLYLTVLVTDDDPAEALDRYTTAYYGAPYELMAAGVRAYVDAGAEHVVVRIGALDGAEAHLEAVADAIGVSAGGRSGN